MPMVPAVLLLSVVSAQAAPPAGPDSIVWRAARAASGDSAASIEARWTADLGRNPDDPIARLGLAALSLYRYRYDAALDGFRDLADSRGSPDAWSVRARLGVGHVLHRRADLAAADSQYVLAAAEARLIADSAALADALINLALVRARTRGHSVAMRLFDDAAAVLPGANERQRALHRCARGVTFVGFNPPVMTREELREGARIAEAAGEPALAATCVFGVAAMHMTRGATDSARILLDRVIELQRAANDRYGLAGVLQRRSWYERAIGDYALATATLAESLEHAAASGNASVEAWASIDLANIALALRDRVSAFEYSERARVLFEQQNDRWGVGAVSTIRAQLSRVAGAIDEAWGFYGAALERQIAATDHLAAIGSYQVLAEIALQRHLPDTAAALLAAARSLAVAGGLTGWERGVRAHEARLAVATGDAVTARRIIEGLLETPHQPPRYYQLRVMKALTDVIEGDLASAETGMLEAGRSLDAWRMSLDDRALRVQAFQPQEASAGAATVMAALAEAGRAETVLRLAEQRRARDLLDRMVMTRAMADDTSTVPSGPARLPDFAGWRSVTPRDQALLYFVTGDGEPTTLLVVTADTALIRIRPAIDSMAGPIDRYRVLLESGADSRSSAVSLARLVFDDALAHPALAGVVRLLIVPDGPLHRLPFASLALDDGTRLVERFALGTAPSASVVMRLAQQPGDDAPARLLALGDPDVDTAGTPGDATRWHSVIGEREGMSRLDGGRREVRRAARYAAEADVRTGADASEAWLRSASLERYDIVHFATHALVDEQSLTRSALVLAPGEGHDGLLAAGELSSLRLNADLVVLSACRSAGGVVLRGEGIHGLTAPLLEAGTRAILATQWRIEDDAVGPLVDDFYAALASGLDAAAALQAAQRSAIARGEPPALWAAFTLVGDPGVTLVLMRPGLKPASWTVIAAFTILAIAVGWRSSRSRASTGRHG